MAAKIEEYVDTSALIAFADKSDSHHELFIRLFADPPKLFTTTLVVAEGHAWFLRRYDRYRALQFLSLVEVMKPLRVIAATPKDQLGATELLRKYSDQDLTLTDALGLWLMQKTNTARCWSTDFHLGLTGAPLVIHQQ